MGGVRFLIILVRCVFEWACVGSPWLLNFFKDTGGLGTSRIQYDEQLINICRRL